jgi:hypothetical protein
LKFEEKPVTRSKVLTLGGLFLSGALSLALADDSGFKLVDATPPPPRVPMLPFAQAATKARDSRRPILAFFTANW